MIDSRRLLSVWHTCAFTIHSSVWQSLDAGKKSILDMATMSSRQHQVEVSTLGLLGQNFTSSAFSVFLHWFVIAVSFPMGILRLQVCEATHYNSCPLCSKLILWTSRSLRWMPLEFYRQWHFAYPLCLTATTAIVLIHPEISRFRIFEE